MTVCEKYSCSISPEFCARRYQKALDNPQDDALLNCRECNYGQCVHGNGALKPMTRKYKQWNKEKSHPSTSNAQMRCAECAAKHKTIKDKLRASKATASHIAEHRHNKGKAAEPAVKEAVRLERPGPHKPGLAGSIPATAPKGVGKHWFGQVLYISDLLDKQIKDAIETGMIDTKILFDCRFRLGEVLRAGGGIEA